jgi:hypothetical protein
MEGIGTVKGVPVAHEGICTVHVALEGTCNVADSLLN